METDHSKLCENRKKNYQNLADINKELSNYQQFRLELIKYVDYNPVIKYTDFKLKSNKLYYKNNFNFEIKDNTKIYIIIGGKILMHIINFLYLKII